MPPLATHLVFSIFSDPYGSFYASTSHPLGFSLFFFLLVDSRGRCVLLVLFVFFICSVRLFVSGIFLEREEGFEKVFIPVSQVKHE
jgi:hypothetical protein